MRLSNIFINNNENEKYIFDYFFSDIILRIFTILWIGYVIFSYNENINRPESLFEPIIWFQQLLIPSQPTLFKFYTIIIIALLLCVYTIISKKIIYRGILFFLLLWLNAVKWNYNFFSHVGHLLLLAHLFSMFIPVTKTSELNEDKIKQFSYAIRWSYAGVLVTYTMAGAFKLIALMYKIIFQPGAINWMSEDAVELNSIVSARHQDEMISDTMLNIYEIPYIWQIATLFIFFIQFVSVLGAFNKKISYIVLPSLVIFHIYNMLFINTKFYVSLIVLIILLFPYHLFAKSEKRTKTGKNQESRQLHDKKTCNSI